jgi:hypothetical protein
VIVVVVLVLGAGAALWVFNRPVDSGTTSTGTTLGGTTPGGTTAPIDAGIDWSDPSELPPPTRDDFRSEFVSDAEGYRFWPRSGRITPSTVYRFDTGHCGLNFLADFDGSFWHPVLAADATAPDFFFNQDVGAIALVDFNSARYRSSSGVEVEMERIRGPVVTQPCE